VPGKAFGGIERKKITRDPPGTPKCSNRKMLSETLFCWRNPHPELPRQPGQEATKAES
jgi:hypothetical protein